MYQFLFLYKVPLLLSRKGKNMIVNTSFFCYYSENKATRHSVSNTSLPFTFWILIFLCLCACMQSSQSWGRKHVLINNDAQHYNIIGSSSKRVHFFVRIFWIHPCNVWWILFPKIMSFHVPANVFFCHTFSSQFLIPLLPLPSWRCVKSK